MEMIHRKRGLAAIAACAAVAVVAVAVVATVTQAESGSNWMVKGAAVAAPLKPQVGVELEKLPSNGPRHLILLTKLGPEITVEILCEEFADIGFLLPGGSGVASTIQLAKCATYINGALTANCAPAEPIAAKAKTLIVLVAGVALVLIEPETGKQFGVIKFEPACILPEEVAITGSLYAKESNGKFQTEEEFHLFAQALGFGGGLLFGGEPMTIDGSGKASLLSPHALFKWSGKPT